MDESLDALYEELEYYKDMEKVAAESDLATLEYIRRRIAIVQRAIKQLESLGSRWG
jgi:hypothetical protein